MDDKQWMATCIFAGIFAAAFLYLPFVGSLPALIIVSIVQGVFIGWQRVSTQQLRLGIFSFAGGSIVGLPIVGLLLSPSGPGNLWGLAAIISASCGLLSILITRFLGKRTPSAP